MGDQLRNVLFIVLFCIITLVAFLTFRQEAKAPQSPQAVSDRSQHPVYSKYSFDNGNEIVNIGIQPLYSSTGFIVETMKRDLVLRQALKERGVELRFFSFLKGADVNYFLKKGKLSGGIGGDMPTLSIASNTKVIIPSLIQRGYTSIVARHSMTLDKLSGERIGFAFGSNAHYALLHALKGVGLSENDVTLMPMDVNKMPDALKNDRVAAFSGWEPTPLLTLAENESSVVVHRHISTGYLYFLDSFYQKSPDVVRLLVAAEIRAINWLRGDLKNLYHAIEWNNRSVEELTDKPEWIPKGLGFDMAHDDLIGETASPIIPEIYLKENGSLHDEFVFLKKLGKIDEKIRWETVRKSFDRSIISEILNYSNKYQLGEYRYDTKDGSHEK